MRFGTLYGAMLCRGEGARFPLKLDWLAGVLLLALFVGCSSSRAPHASEDILVPTLSVTETDSFTFRFAALGLALDLAPDEPSSSAEDEAYAWDFGDGGGATGKVAEHTYAAEGRYEVTLAVTDALGAVYTLTRYVYARPLALSLSSGATDLAQNRTFTFQNTADAPLTWSLDAEHDPANPSPGGWFEARPDRGTLAPGERVTLNLSPNPGLEPGFYLSTLSVAHPGGALEFDVAAQLGPAQPRVSLSVPRAVVTQGRSEAGLSVWVSGFAGSAYLSLEDAPPALQLRLPDPKISDTEAGLLSLSPTLDTPPGEYLVTLNAQSSEAQDVRASVTLVVEVLARGAGRASVSGQVVTENAAIGIPVDAGEEAEPGEAGQAATTPSVAENQARPAFVPGQLLLSYREEAQGAIKTFERGAFLERQTRRKALVAELGRTYDFGVVTTLGRVSEPGHVDLVALAPGRDVLQTAAQLARDPRVAHAEPNYYVSPSSSGVSASEAERPSLPDDPLLPEQWALAAAGVPAAWSAISANVASADVTVAVLDSGFDLAHPDLAAQFVPGIDFCAGETACGTQMDDDPSYNDPSNGHGTHVAGIIGAVPNNGEGVAGVARSVRLLPIRVLKGPAGGGTVASLIQGIRWAAGLGVAGAPPNDYPARIINLSIGGLFHSALVQEAVNDARDAGALLIAATGNHDPAGVIRTPAAAKGVLGVGAVDTYFERSHFSNYGQRGIYGPGGVDLMAPGGGGGALGVLSTWPGGYQEEPGTSMATPIVSGLAALLLAEQPELSVVQLERKLLAATYFDPKTMDEYEYGAGVIRAERLFDLPSPGDEVTVAASGQEGDAEGGAVDYVKLDLYGGSEPFSLKGLKEERYTLEVAAGTTNRAYSSSKTLELAVGELQTTLPLSLNP